MIDADTIRTIAASKSIHPGVIEKDYVLSKVLMSIAQRGESAAGLVFKGGTALKKCYYPEWRYSEDLDFTAHHRLSPPEIQNLFEAVVRITTDAFGLPIRVSEYSQYPKGANDIVAAQLKLTYDGPLRQSSGQKNNIRVDIALDEAIISESVPKRLAMEYGDDIEVALSVYSLEEIVAEKMRSILQRGKSRDYYDVWVLLTQHGSDFDHDSASAIFFQKCQSKGIPQPKLEDFFRDDQLAEAQAYWERGLAHQLSDLPTFSSITESLRNEIQKLLLR